MTHSITLTLPYPVSTNRYWASRVVAPKGGGRPMAMVYVTAEAKAYKAEVERIARVAGIRAPITGRVQLEIWLYPHRPLDYKKRQRLHGAAWDDTVQCIDLGNAEKVLSDALINVVTEDDKWTMRISMQKMEPDDKPARVIVRVTKIETPKPQQEIRDWL